jgi:GNAT superfamily N-acetyltransferase
MLDLFIGTGILIDDIELFKDYLGLKYKSNRLIITKTKEKMYLVHENNYECDMSNYSGRIYVLSASGIIGLLTYESIKIPGVILIKGIQYKEPDYYGIGIGSGIINYLQQYAIEKKIGLIKGNLETYDIENNRERLMNFYSKHDFNIDFYHREVKKIMAIE